MKSMLSLDPVVLAKVQKELVEKENKERILTEQWTEKWKEAANILQEQEALALKRTGKSDPRDEELTSPTLKL